MFCRRRRAPSFPQIRDKSAVEWRKLAEELLQTAFEAQESEEAEVNVENALELVKERYAEAASFGERCKRIYIAAINDAEELRQEATEEKAAAEGLVKEKKAALEALQAKMRRIREPDSAVTPTNDADVLAVLRKSEGVRIASQTKVAIHPSAPSLSLLKWLVLNPPQLLVASSQRDRTAA